MRKDAARASGSDGSCTPRCGSSRSTRRREESRRAPTPGGGTCTSSRRRSRSTGGTATGIGARIFDDGSPLGSVVNAECRIDSIAQSWGVLSGAADPARASRAMAAVEEYLVRRGQELILLFTPPFDRSPVEPGYIKGYPPGMRENGGQYTHAAIWAVMAFAALGDGDKANELFSILNPINRASTRAGVHRYKVEPYVIAADVYAERPHVGRGGWTWYTGSAGWMHRAGIEWLLGFRLRGTRPPARPVHSAGMARFLDRVPVSCVALRDHGREPARCHPRDRDDGGGRAPGRRRPAGYCRFPTTAPGGRSGWCWDPERR